MALLGELDDSCCWFRVPKIYLDFVFDDKDLVTVYSNFGPNNKFVLDLSLKVPAFSLIIEFFLVIYKIHENIKPSYVRTCVHGLPQK